MKRFEATRTRLYISIAASFIFVLFALLALFLPDKLLNNLDLPTDKTARYIAFGVWMAVFVMCLIYCFFDYKRYLRIVDTVNAFIEKCGESAVIMYALYYHEDPQDIQLMKDHAMYARPNSPIPSRIRKIVANKDNLKFAVIGDNGIYIINRQDIATPEKNIFYKRNNTREHPILTNAQQAIMLDYPECNVLFVFGINPSRDKAITQDELIQKLTDLYGKKTDTASDL